MQTKYDWSKAPEEVQWIATDGYSSRAWGYVNKPSLEDDCFVEMHCDEWPIVVDVAPFLEDWQDSLEQRPQVLNDFGFDFKQKPSNTVELGMHMLEEGVK